MSRTYLTAAELKAIARPEHAGTYWTDKAHSHLKLYLSIQTSS